MKVIFRDNIKSYLLVLLIGILAGLLVVMCFLIPNNELWAFSYWSTETFGFWMFSTSLMVLLSEKRKTAIINAFMYVFIMFLITTIYQSYKMYFNFYTPFDSKRELLISSINGWLLYSIIPSLICGILGAILWSGRKNKIYSKLFCALPAVFILIEMIILFISVFTNHTKLFSAITDLIWLILYIVFLIKNVFRNNLCQ
mgnify:CR=1 FL=1